MAKIKVFTQADDDAAKAKEVDDFMAKKLAERRAAKQQTPPAKQATGFNALRGVLSGEYNKPEQIKKGGW